MADQTEPDLDAALDRLAAAERRAAPVPSADLVARVLADAAAQAPAASSAPPERPGLAARAAALWRRATGPRLGPSFAAGTMALSLALGLGLGYTDGAEPLPAEVAALAADPLFGFAPDDIGAAALF